jgi:hypothetical protein
VPWAIVLVQSLAIAPASAALQRRSSSRPSTRSIKIAVLAKEGIKESRARNTVMRALRANRGVQIASNRETASAKAAYQGSGLSEKDIMSISEERGIAAFALVEVSGRKSLTVTVTIRNGEDGAVLEEAQWSKLSPSRLKSVQRTFWKTLGVHIAKAKVHQTVAPSEPPPPPVPETPAPAATAPKEPEPTPPVAPPTEAPVAAAPSAMAARSPEPSSPTAQVSSVPRSEAVDPERLTLDLAVGAGAFSRDFSYSADATALGSYHMNIGPMLSGSLQWYPLAPATISFVSWIGLIGSGDYGLGLKSSTPNGPSLRTSSYRYSGGLKFRIPMGNSELGLSGSYGSSTFSIKDQNPPAGSTAIPDVKYRFIRPELSARVGVLRTFWILAGASYMQALKGGQITSTFPNATAKGFGGSFGLAWEVSDSIELRVIAEYSRIALTMNSQPQDPVSAQGAVDQYLLGRGTFAYRWK